MTDEMEAGREREKEGGGEWRERLKPESDVAE